MTDVSAVTRACDRIRKRATDPRLALVPGLADDLKMIGEAFAELQRDQIALANDVVGLAIFTGAASAPPERE